MTDSFLSSRETALANPTTAPATPDGFPGPTTVLLITSRSDMGPAPRTVAEMLRFLKEKSFRVFVASPVNPPYGYEFKKSADRFIPIPHRGFSFNALWRLYKSIKKHKVGIIHSHGRAAGVYSRLLSVVTKAGVVHSYHGVASGSDVESSLKLGLDVLLANLKFSPLFSSESEERKALSKNVVRADRERHTLPVAVDVTRFLKRKSTTLAMAKVDPAKPETYTNLRIGAILRPENPTSLSHFLKIAREAGAQGSFTCAGVTRNQLSKCGVVPDSLEIMGPIADTATWLSSVDVFVSTTTSDTPVVDALDAMAAGAICILSAVPNHERYHSQNAAVLFNAEDVQDFIRALQSLRVDKSMRDMVVGNSRYMIERFHDVATYRAKLLEVYRDALRR